MSIFDQDHNNWAVGDVVVHVATGKPAVIRRRKTRDEHNRRDAVGSFQNGWWVTDVDGTEGGGISDTAPGWCSLHQILDIAKHAERAGR